jgi:hypothetical protein
MLIFIKIILSCATVIAWFLLTGYLAQKLDPGILLRRVRIYGSLGLFG